MGLRTQVERMAAVDQQQVAMSVRALMGRDRRLAAKVIELEPAIHAYQRNIEQASIETIARRQPFAIDLRELICAFRISCDLQRIGVLARNICRSVLATADAEPAPPAGRFRQLADLVSDSLARVIESYSERDDEKALLVWENDAEVDAAHASLFRDLLTHMTEDPRNIPACTHLLFCAKNMERIGDHATNIAESVHYLLMRRMLDTERPRGVDTISQSA